MPMLRSTGEFSTPIPGDCRFFFSNNERAEIGTAYKQVAAGLQ